MPKNLILVPGAWHTAACFDLITPHLHHQGFTVNALTLPGVAADKTDSFNDDVQTIRSAVLDIIDAGEDVAVVMHSYGAVPGCEAMKDLSKAHRTAQGRSGGVVALVFLCAWAVPVGQSIGSLANMQGFIDQGEYLKEENGRLHFLKPIDVFYHDLPIDEAEKRAAMLGTHDASLSFTNLSYPAYWDIPSSYLACRNDIAIPYEMQLMMIDNAKFEHVETWDSGHSPFLSRPEDAADFIARGVDKYLN
ncbi:hypothetical protein ASPWEDRAFT_26401 [Aspergillus wentii DTO 134E9]|uniref:AB hydrolase-1 domain-containing protein n=1 Tax=Aspergillus wentii DTO 134E9 TaxID=1073089 RepID=A0A1L9RQ70_ASPWE|nr:uncharacterized protein ASPWEDRAFT_26401 [Aspergillus wentii DTO 134E9]KAI9923899.1 hypothetical protein MW887_008204 [Aspergillus wentii]OJJ36968.1 hypothetical protein ASPWEDRAFT_26401 [Aspergillus wentii DTO 134E9]